MRIVDRSNGVVLGELAEDQADVIGDLVEEVQSFQVSEMFLDASHTEGVDGELLKVLRAALDRSPTLFVGLEPQVGEGGGFTLQGTLVDAERTPLGGLAVTAQNSDDEALGWAFSRPDGAYTLKLNSIPTNAEVFVSARGGLLLSSLELDGPSSGIEEIDPIGVLTLRGKVVKQDGTPLSAGRVEVWGSWAVTDTDGGFCLPVERLGEEVVIEVFAASGQPLGGYWTVTTGEVDPAELGVRVVPVPDAKWPDSDEALIAPLNFHQDSVYPGVSDRPLS